MKICAFFHGILQKDLIILKATDERDLFNIRKLFNSKTEREHRSKKEILLKCEIDAAFQHRSYKQNNAVWKLVTVIFQNDSENNRLPTEEEKYLTYYSLLDLYADKMPNKYDPMRLIPVHISKANTVEAARFIENLLNHIATQCNLPTDLEATVRSVLYEWEISRYKLSNDIDDDRNIRQLVEDVKFSEASGRGGILHRHHIVTRGACPAAKDKAWNIMVLTEDEHNFFHQQCKNWDEFLEVYPHLRGKVENAQKKCALLVQQNNSIGNLADMALSLQND